MEKEDKKKKEENIEIGIDIFKYLYMKAKEHLITEDEAIKDNLTETFWEYIVDKLKHKEIVNIAIRGEPRTHKSTVGMKILNEGLKAITIMKINLKAKELIRKLIFSDETEFLRFIDNPIRDVIALIDEKNALAKTGYNATTEEALLEYYSDVFAGQYVNRITISIDKIIDKNATIILDTIGGDETKKTTRCKLSYRDPITKYPLVLGYIDVYTGDITKEWDESGIRKIVEGKDRSQWTNEETNKVDEAIKRSFYIWYQNKKYKRMDLLKKHGIRDIRELEFAEIVLETVTELSEYARIGRVENDIVQATCDEIIRRHRRIYSILTKSEIAQKCRAILTLYNNVQKITKRINGTNKIRPTQIEIQVLEKAKKRTQEMLDNQVKEQEKLSKLYKQYINTE